MVPQAVRRYLEAVQATPPEAVWAGVPGLAPGVHHFVPLPASSTGPARNTEWGSPVRYRFDPRIFNDETTDRIGAHLIDLEEPDVWEFGPPPSGLDQEWWSLPGAVRAAVCRRAVAHPGGVRVRAERPPVPLPLAKRREFGAPGQACLDAEVARWKAQLQTPGSGRRP